MSCHGDHIVLTLAEAVNNMELEVGEGGEGDVDQLQHGLQPPHILAQHGDALPVIRHVLPDVFLHRGRVWQEE